MRERKKDDAFSCFDLIIIEREKNYLLFSGAQNGRKFLLIDSGCGREI